MPATVHPPLQGLTRDVVNPRTGRPWRLSDSEVKAELAAEIQAMRENPDLAKEFLRDVGILTKGGRLSRRFGGK